jgi:hypothetical protein
MKVDELKARELSDNPRRIRQGHFMTIAGGLTEIYPQDGV